MFVELIESLRCPRDHEESPLIASSGRTVERHIENVYNRLGISGNDLRNSDAGGIPIAKYRNGTKTQIRNGTL